MFSRISRFVILAVMVLALSGISQAGVKLGTISIGAGYAHAWGCCYGPYEYSDYLYGPYWGPFGPYYPFGYFTSPAPDKGTVKLINPAKDAEVYIDSAYAGKATDLKKISIKPGAYNLELRVAGQDPIQKRIYVLSGKTIKLEF